MNSGTKFSKLVRRRSFKNDHFSMCLKHFDEMSEFEMWIFLFRDLSNAISYCLRMLFSFAV